MKNNYLEKSSNSDCLFLKYLSIKFPETCTKIQFLKNISKSVLDIDKVRRYLQTALKSASK